MSYAVGGREISPGTTDPKATFSGVFSRHAAAYRDRIDGILTRGEARGRELVLELLDVGRGERALDLGCGPGTLTRRLAAAAGAGGQAVGVDLAPGMLRLARASAPAGAGFALMDLERLALGDATFDAAACGHALQFCPELGRALSEARRVLRRGGRFAASVPAGRAGRPAWQLLEEVFERLLPARPDVPEVQPTRAVTADPQRLREAALAAGFAQAEVRRVEELVTYRSPAELVGKTMSWWECAWRLEALSPGERDHIRAEAIVRLRSKLGDGRLELPGATHVLFAVP